MSLVISTKYYLVVVVLGNEYVLSCLGNAIRSIAVSPIRMNIKGCVLRINVKVKI